MSTYTLAVYLLACNSIVSGPPKCTVENNVERLAGYPSLASCQRAGRALDAELHDVKFKYNYVCLPDRSSTDTPFASDEPNNVVRMPILTR